MKLSKTQTRRLEHQLPRSGSSLLESQERYIKKLEAVVEAARPVLSRLLREPLLHGDEKHRAWLTAEVRNALGPMLAAIAALDQEGT